MLRKYVCVQGTSTTKITEVFSGSVAQLEMPSGLQNSWER